MKRRFQGWVPVRDGRVVVDEDAMPVMYATEHDARRHRVKAGFAADSDARRVEVRVLPKGLRG